MKWGMFLGLALGGGVLVYHIGKAAVQRRTGVVAVEDIDVRGNARRIPEGFILSGRHEAVHVPRIAELGITTIISAVEPSNQVLMERFYSNIRTILVPISSRFRHPTEILQALDVPPEQVLIHCEHGVDRTGCIAAFLLVALGWSIPDALYAVVNPSPTDVDGLAEVLAQHGIQDRRRESDPRVGIYSLAPLGRSGGLKVRSEGYRELVSTTIDAMRQLGRHS